MKRIFAMMLSVLLVFGGLATCKSELPADTDNNVSDMETETNQKNSQWLSFPEELEAIPEEYFSSAQQQGTLTELYYSTYESKTYEQKSKQLEKRAIIYLPYGYSEERKYNVFYLMHGGWSNETTTLGTPERPSALKNVLDHAIAEGEKELPRAGAVIMQYTGHSDYTENDPPTYACVGENDGIASWRTMQQRLEQMEALGIDTEFHHYPGLRHGFGIGTGTVAEGWLDEAVAFWEKQKEGE